MKHRTVSLISSTIMQHNIQQQQHSARGLTSYLCAEVDLHDVAVLQHGVVAHVGGVVRRHVVDRAARGERNASLSGLMNKEQHNS